MANKEVDYWFPAKRYGWGWGVPRTWQGWAVVATYAVLFVLGMAFQERLGALMFVAYMVAISASLVLVCWFKGEPPRWRWGGK